MLTIARISKEDYFFKNHKSPLNRGSVVVLSAFPKRFKLYTFTFTTQKQILYLNYYLLDNYN